MRHGVKGRKLKRTSSHRAALLSGLATSLLLHKKIRTTEAKAKEMRRYVEPIITRAKRAIALNADSSAPARIHARREIGRVIHDEAAIKALFTEVAPKVAERAGGYTRVIKLGYRHGDNAEMAMLELVDFTGGETTEAPKAKMAKPRPTRNKAKTAEAKLADHEETAAPEAAPKKPRATRKKKAPASE
ncbi:MAG: 50S ribosomal protein L17 [Bacteroidota bacterium]|nr:50S ribosomal protein L17 [Bacteroidota bacterium]MDP4232520.1 50S ribosomal protein L17 [Bacteroidota bacterium]MDP4241655.1 50S ribosomal protein L17 [Bacteroidota bacterium]MDP4286400.1 50S ribosomal protein L17 [Bacteroidota bacterium]